MFHTIVVVGAALGCGNVEPVRTDAAAPTTDAGGVDEPADEGRLIVPPDSVPPVIDAATDVSFPHITK